MGRKRRSLKRGTPAGGARKTVLVVDDDPECLVNLARALGPCYGVLSATNGDEALRRAQRSVPDAIVLDVMMPGGKDGFATYAELQRDSRTQAIPVLMLSSVNRKTGLDFGAEEMNRYLGKAPAAFLEKPISAARLLTAVRKALHETPPATGGSSTPTQRHGPRARTGGHGGARR